MTVLISGWGAKVCRAPAGAYRFVDELASLNPPDDPAAGYSIPPEPAKRLALVENSLNSFRAWGADVKAQITGLQAGFQVLQNGQDVLAGEVTDLVSSRKPVIEPGPDPVMGYQPSIEQLMVLFEALAEWQAAAPELTKGGTASFKTLSGNDASYDYATPGDVSKLARTAGAHGLGHWHREIVLESYSIIRTYLVHKAGGFVYSDVPLLQKENKMLSPIQSWAVANTAAKRLGILSVLGILPGDSDDAGNPATSQGRTIETRGRSVAPGPGTGANKPPPLPSENVRVMGARTTTAAPTTTVTGNPVTPPSPASTAGPFASD